jgi:hypothetical protein
VSKQSFIWPIDLFPILPRDIIDVKRLELIIARLQVVAIHNCLKSKLIGRRLNCAGSIAAPTIRTGSIGRRIDERSRTYKHCDALE